MKYEITVKTILLESFMVEAESRSHAIELVECGDCIPDYNEILEFEILGENNG